MNNNRMNNDDLLGRSGWINFFKMILALTALVLIVHFTRECERSSSMDETKETFGVHAGSVNSVGNNQKLFEFRTSNGKLIQAAIDYYGKARIGDTVWIKYSISKPTIAEVVDEDYIKYMKNVHP